MKAQLVFECKNCINDIAIEITIEGKNMPTLGTIREKAQQEGWSIGRDCYCPSCLRQLPAHCDTCEHFEGYKSMGSFFCRKECCFTTPYDYCKHHRPIHSDKNKEEDE